MTCLTLSRRTLLALAAAAIATPALAQEKTLKVVASFSILGDMVARIGGPRISLTTLVGPDSDAHVYAATPGDAKSVGEAGLIIMNGLKFEGWLGKLVAASGTKAVVTEAARGIATIKVAGGHDHKDRHGHNHGGEADPHAWQDAAQALIYVRNIADALIAADPAGRAEYEARATAYLAEIAAVDAEAKAAFARIPREQRKIITGHDAFGYFARAYGVTFIAPRGVSTEGEASAKDVAAVIRQAKRDKVKAVFLENITNPKLIEQIAKESGARVGGRLYSDALSAPGGPAGTYIDMMRHNIRQIAAAFDVAA